MTFSTQKRSLGLIGILCLSLAAASLRLHGGPATKAGGVAQLQADWLFQADGKVTVNRIQKEIGWAREIATRMAKQTSAPDLAKPLARLKTLEVQAAGSLGKAKLVALYYEVRKTKRQILFSDPAIDFDRILLIDNPYPNSKKPPAEYAFRGSEWGHEARHRNGLLAADDGKLLVLDGLTPGSKTRNLLPGKVGSFWRPDLSYDGKTIVFCFKPKADDSFHLYEIGVDGKGLKQLTRGDYDDLDPIYAPDGHLLFSTSRGNTYIRCMPQTHSFQLARCDGDGKNIYIISRNSECDFTPAIMNDGKVLYTRWEYTDKALWRAQSLWTANPDGTQVATFWGNQSVWPDMQIEARAIPGSNRIMFIGAGHHAWFDGSVGILDPKEGMNYPKGLTRVTADQPWPESGNGPAEKIEKANYHASGKFYAYKSPYPLSEELFLVSARIGKKLYNGSDHGWKFGLYLMDVYGNRELIYRGKENAIHAIPIRARKRPPVLADRVAWPKIGSDEPLKPGVMFSNNVFANAPDIPREKVKYLRIIEMDHKTYTTWFKTAQHDGPAVSVTQAETVKRILGTVPVEADGSVCFSCPPGKAVFFQLLDKDYQCVKTMRSFTGIMPGENRGCLGCHESKTSTPFPSVKQARIATAFRKGPASITPPPWGKETVGYLRFAQPLLDKHCGKCHQGKGKAVAKLNLTLRDSKHGWRWRVGTRPGDGSVFPEPYLTLVSKGKRVPWGRAGQFKVSKSGAIVDNLAGVLVVEAYGQRDPASYATLPAMSTFSPVSKLVQIASSGKHHGVKMPAADLRRLVAWVDCNGPYLGREEIRNMYDPTFRNIELLPVRPRVGTAPDINRFNLRQDGDSAAIAGRPVRLFGQWPNGETPVIVKATYGTKTKSVDVTKKLNAYLKTRTLASITSYNTVFGDPVQGEVKQLTVTYSGNGKTAAVTLAENRPILLPYPAKP